MCVTILLYRGGHELFVAAGKYDFYFRVVEAVLFLTKENKSNISEATVKCSVYYELRWMNGQILAKQFWHLVQDGALK